MADEQGCLELSLLAEQKVAEQSVGAFAGGAADAGQGGTVIVDDLGADHGRRAQQAADQLLGQFSVNVVGDACSRIVADLHQRTNLAVDGGIFTGIIDADLKRAKRHAEDKRHQHGPAGLFE